MSTTHRDNKADISWTEVSVEVALRLIVGGCLLITETAKTPFVRLVQPSDWHYYSFPFKQHELVPAWLLLVIVIIVPALVVGMLAFSVYTWRKQFIGDHPPLAKDCLDSFLSYSLGLLFTFLLTVAIKKTYGYLRPDFLSRCFPHGWNVTDLSPIPQCSSDASAKVITDGRMSFPSGHSAVSFCCFTFCSLYSFAKLYSLRHKNIGALPLVVAIGFFIPPIVIAISRTADYRHHYQDIMAGATLGIIVQLSCYRYYAPFSYNNGAVQEEYRSSTLKEGEESRAIDLDV